MNTIILPMKSWRLTLILSIPLSNQDFKKFDEKYIKAIFVGFASLSKLYFIKSEPEIESKYTDIMFLHRPPFYPKYQFLFEIKY
jgi:hypothetical protein